MAEIWWLRIFFDGHWMCVRRNSDWKPIITFRIVLICIFLICFTEFNRFAIANRLSRMRALTWQLRLCIRPSVALKLLSVAGKRSIARNYERLAIRWKRQPRQVVRRRTARAHQLFTKAEKRSVCHWLLTAFSSMGAQCFVSSSSKGTYCDASSPPQRLLPPSSITFVRSLPPSSPPECMCWWRRLSLRWHIDTSQSLWQFSINVASPIEPLLLLWSLPEWTCRQFAEALPQWEPRLTLAYTIFDRPALGFSSIVSFFINSMLLFSNWFNDSCRKSVISFKCA